MSLSKVYAGAKLKMMMTEHGYGAAIQARLPEFTKATGIELELEQVGFPVLNQRADLELSSGSGAYDVLQLIFIRSGRWIGAGWCEDLMPYIEDPNKTDKASLNLEDFVSGATQPFKKGDGLFGLPWLADSTMMVYREDVFTKAGYDKFPATFDELQQAVPKVEDAGKIKGFVTEDNLHWIWPNFLMSYGGNYFRNPPQDLHPAFDTDAAKTAAGMFTELLAKHTPMGGAAQSATDAELAIKQGTAASFIDGLGNLGETIDQKTSKFRDQVRFVKSPSGPAGYFPQLAVHGLMINKASKQKDAAWEFIKWATSKDMQIYGALEHNHIANTRSSMLHNSDVRQRYSWHGTDLPTLHEEVMQRAGSGYMVYRTIPQFPPVGDRVTIALTAIASGQKSVEEGLAELQNDVTDILIKQGVQL